MTLNEVVVEKVDTDCKLSWGQIFASADDALLCQMAVKGKLVFLDGDGGQTPIFDGVGQFAVVVLGNKVCDGDAIWGVELPTVEKEDPKEEKPA